MHINLRNLEAINELPFERVMLNQNQLRRLEAIDCWLREIRDSGRIQTTRILSRCDA
ncbi:MAG: hypothetical protein ACYTXT_37535 [Nostoc sp.]